MAARQNSCVSTTAEHPQNNAPIAWLPALLLVGLMALIAAMPASAFRFEPQDPCEHLTDPGPQDRWALMEYRVAATGNAESLKVPFASDLSYANSLTDCAGRGSVQLPTRSGHVYKVFRFAPARDQQILSGGRILDFEIPDSLKKRISNTSFTGHLALRLEINELGMIRSKELLFASSGRLGNLVLDYVDDGLEVVNRGQVRGPYTDVIYLRFENGSLVSFEQSHFVAREQLAQGGLSYGR